MVRLSATAVTTATLVFAAAALSNAQVENDNPNGKPFFISEPSCNSWKCHKKVKQGEDMKINWFHPIKGKIDISLNPEKDGDGFKAFDIAKGIDADSGKDKCDKGGQKSCGMYNWTVPKDAKPGDYSVDIHSLSKKDVHGYSDVVEITPA